MNNYTFDEIQIGAEEHFEKEITDEMMNLFGLISGDENPLHTSEEFAVSKGYNGKVVYGMLTGSLLSCLAGMYIPGKNSLIYNVNISFVSPVYINDILNVKGIVVEKDERFKTIDLKVSITNQNINKVCRGSMKIGVAR